MSESYHIYNAVFTATYNVHRRKNKRALNLWRKAKVQKADMEVVKDNLSIIREVEKKEGLSWVEKVFKANGLPFPGKKKKKGGVEHGGLHSERKDNR